MVQDKNKICYTISMDQSRNLTDKKCVPCEGGMKPLERNEFSKYLNDVPDWTVVEDKKIEKEFKFKTFKEALGFINKVGELAEEEGHHPDVYLHGYNKVKFTLSTHAIGGFSENDFIMAAKINTLVKNQD